MRNLHHQRNTHNTLSYWIKTSKAFYFFEAMFYMLKLSELWFLSRVVLISYQGEQAWQWKFKIPVQGVTSKGVFVLLLSSSTVLRLNIIIDNLKAPFSVSKEIISFLLLSRHQICFLARWYVQIIFSSTKLVVLLINCTLHLRAENIVWSFLWSKNVN